MILFKLMNSIPLFMNGILILKTHVIQVFEPFIPWRLQIIISLNAFLLCLKRYAPPRLVCPREV